MTFICICPTYCPHPLHSSIKHLMVKFVQGRLCTFTGKKSFKAIKSANCESPTWSDACPVTIESCTQGENAVGLSEVSSLLWLFPAMGVSQTHPLVHHCACFDASPAFDYIYSSFSSLIPQALKLPHPGSC